MDRLIDIKKDIGRQVDGEVEKKRVRSIDTVKQTYKGKKERDKGRQKTVRLKETRN